MQIKNAAAWILQEKSQLVVAAAPFPICGDDELVIKNHAVAINPVDWKVQDSGGFSLSYPTILGEDIAGEVREVGKNLRKTYNVGDRIIANALGFEHGATYGGFQLYPLVSPATASVIPDDLAWNDAVVLPLSISTAAAGLYQKATLNLSYPKLKEEERIDYGFEFTGKRKKQQWLLLWGGSSSVGSSVIQLARASGYHVLTTASPANYSYAKDLGADLVLDYHNPDVVKIAIGLLKDEKVVGAYDAIGTDATVKQSAAVLSALGGGLIASVVAAPDDLPKGVEVKRIGSSNIVSKEPEVAKKVWVEFLPKALAEGTFRAAPKPLVVGKGLNNVQKALDRQKEGVSARKVVVEL